MNRLKNIAIVSDGFNLFSVSHIEPITDDTRYYPTEKAFSLIPYLNKEKVKKRIGKGFNYCPNVGQCVCPFAQNDNPIICNSCSMLVEKNG